MATLDFCTFTGTKNCMNDLIVTLVQTDIVWENKEANRQNLESKINSIQTKTQVVVLPEMFTTGFSMHPEKFAETMNGESVGWMRTIARKKNIILTGSLVIQDNNQYYNRLVWALPNGQIHHYDKRHLFGYAGEDQHYTAGKNRTIVSVNGWRILLQVCYDLRFPVWARQEAAAGNLYEYDAIVYVANWPEKRRLPWKTLLQARAIENMSYVIGVNRVGYDGNNFYHSGDAEDLFTYTLQKEELEKTRNRFPFAKDADHFNIKTL